ncbi:MAG: hypothetical protein ACHRHE_09130 [Tepidisphaerales bacterium]
MRRAQIRNIRRGMALLAAALVFGGAVRVSAITITTPAGASTGGGPVSAEADLTMSADTITLTLKNLTVNPGNIAQNLSAFTFTLNSSFGSNSLTSSSGVERTVNSNGTFTQGGSVATGWVESNPSGNTLELDVLTGTGHAGPAHTLIGAPDPTAPSNGLKYTSANGSIAGNGPHNPFLDETATFTLHAVGVTAATSVTSAIFQFGTTDGSCQVSVTYSNPLDSGVPLPAAAWSGLVLLGVLAGLRWRRRAQAN